MKERPLPTKVRVFCTESTRSVKAKVLDHNTDNLKVELPTGFVMKFTKKTRPTSCYYYRIGQLEFTTDGILIN